MKQGTTRGTLTTSVESKPERKKRGRPKALTSRDYFAGVAMGALLTKAYGMTPSGMEDLKREAFVWADFMLEGDEEE